MRISDWSADVCSSDLHVGASSPCRHVELQFPRHDFGNQAKCLQPLDAEIVEAAEFDPPVVHRANAAQHLPLGKMQDGLTLLEELPRLILGALARRVADPRHHPARRYPAADDAPAVIGLDAVKPSTILGA